MRSFQSSDESEGRVRVRSGRIRQRLLGWVEALKDNRSAHLGEGWGGGTGQRGWPYVIRDLTKKPLMIRCIQRIEGSLFLVNALPKHLADYGEILLEGLFQICIDPDGLIFF
jgi:hypothetical protein